jgi:hypothetical protein
MVSIASEACGRCLGALSEPSEDGFLLASPAESRRVRPGWLNFLNEQGKGIGAVRKAQSEI